MKRTVIALSLLCCLCCLAGCAALVPDEYLSVTPHVDSSSASSVTDAVPAEDYQSLKNAILGFVRTGQADGVIHVTNYDGEVETDLAEAAYEVSKQEPLGAYAVDYMTHSCTQIVSYYEIRVHITFRRTAQELAQIQSVSTQIQLQEKLQSAVDSHAGRLTVRLSSYREQDQEIPAYVADYCTANPAQVMETPSVAVSVYPESGSVRILEINFTYTHSPEELKAMKSAVQESLHAAAEYIRYRETEREKVQLLFTYLMERFSYEPADTATPLYDALCSGVADPKGLTQAWQLICDQAGVECYTVSGMRDGESYTWNIIATDSGYRHLDLARCMLELGDLTLWTDLNMSGYYWNDDLYPACEPISAPPPMEETPPEEPSDEQVPEAPEPPEGEPPVEVIEPDPEGQLRHTGSPFT